MNQQTTTAQVTTRWQVMDVRAPGVTHGTYNTLRAAYRRADRIDSEYGAVRCVVQRVNA